MYLWLLLLVCLWKYTADRSSVVLIVFTFMLRSCICFLHGCGGIANLQCTSWGLAYIVCVPCIGEYKELCITGFVLLLPHLCPLLLPMVCGL